MTPESNSTHIISSPSRDNRRAATMILRTPSKWRQEFNRDRLTKIIPCKSEARKIKRELDGGRTIEAVARMFNVERRMVILIGKGVYFPGAPWREQPYVISKSKSY